MCASIQKISNFNLISHFSRRVNVQIAIVAGDATAVADGDVPDEPDAHHDAPKSPFTPGKSPPVKFVSQYFGMRRQNRTKV